VYISLGLYILFLFGGELMANKQNLIPGGHKLTQEEQSKGGKASGEARRNKKMLRDCIDYLLEREDKKVLDNEGNPMSGAEQLAYNLFVKALTETDTAKSAKAFEVLRDTAGQKPVEKVVISEIDTDVIDEVERMVNDDEKTSG
jgi:hypothetical protein